jgi:hypothetical protein
MSKLRAIGLFALASAAAGILASPRRRRLIAQKLAEARRFVSRQAAVIEPPRSPPRAAVQAWEDEGGALRGSTR